MTASVAALALGAGTLGLIGPSYAATARYCHGHRATIVMAAHQRRAVGTKHRDVIIGNAELNHIRGRGGDDVICGGAGPDSIFGGKGQDELYGGKLDDRLFGGGGHDRLFGGVFDDYLVGGKGDDVVDAGPSTTDHANYVLEGPGDDRDILAAYDRLLYSGGSIATAPPVDVDLGAGTANGQGHDRLVTPTHTTAWVSVPPGSTVHGSPYRDAMDGIGATLYGGAGDDSFFVTGSEVHGNAGNDYIEGSSSEDYVLTIDGGRGSDRLYSYMRPGHDATLDGGPGPENVATVSLYPAKDQTTPFPSVDLDLAAHLTVGTSTWPFSGFQQLSLTVYDGVASAVTAQGTDGPDGLEILAGAEPVTIHALGGDDHVMTGAGDDTVDGGDGSDTADTAGGLDTCVAVEQPTHCESVTP